MDWMPQLPHCIGKLNGLEEKENAWFQNLQLPLFEAWQCQVDNKSPSTEWLFEVIWTDPNGRQAMCICTCIFVIVYLYMCLLLVCLNLYNLRGLVLWSDLDRSKLTTGDRCVDFKGWVNRCSIQGWTHQISFNFYFPQIQNQIRMGWGSQVFRLTKTKMACI